MKFLNSLSLTVLFMTASANAAVNYVITGYAAGSAPIVSTRLNSTTDVSGSGGPTNTILKAAGDATYVDFKIGNANDIVGDKFLAANINTLPTVATLRVTLQAVSTGGTEIMIARTSNSQGLQDVGTLTLLLSGLDGVNVNTQVNSATFRFDWRTADNLAPMVGSNQMVFTSYDIDFGQRNEIPTADISSLGVNSPTELAITTVGPTTIIRDAAPESDSAFSEPKNAYAFVTTENDFSQSISVSKTGATQPGGNQLYMFSFRSPSPLLPNVPEPSSALIAGLGALTLLRRRRA